MPTRVEVNTEVLRWAVERGGQTLEDLRGKFPRLSDWAKGVSQPTFRQLETLANATHTPFGYFFLERPPKEGLPIPHFRTIPSSAPMGPSPDLIETVHMMQRRQAWMREFLIDQGAAELPIVRLAETGEHVAAVADKLRGALRLNNDWASTHSTWERALAAFREAIEASGILVVVNGIVGNNTSRRLDVGEFRGFVLVDEYAPLIFVNGADGRAAQMFTLAHELAHVAFGSSAAFDLRTLQPADDAIERMCNETAAEFLIPEIVLRAEWTTASQSDSPFRNVARRFKVSEIVAVRRLVDLGLIDRENFFTFYREYSDRIRMALPQRSGGDFYAVQNQRIGRNFAKAVIRATREGKLLFSEAYRLTGLHGKTFEQYAETLGYAGTR